MRKILAGLALLFSLNLLQAQEAMVPRHAVSIELLGPGLIYSLNYENYLYRKPYYKLAARVGANFTVPQFEGKTLISTFIPLSLNSIFFNGKHHFEIDLGVLPQFFGNREGTSAVPSRLFPIIAPAYRLQPDKKALFLKVSLTPTYFPREFVEGRFFYWPGVAFGYGF